MQRSNVYAGAKDQIVKGFSNTPEILQAYPKEFLQTFVSTRRSLGLGNGCAFMPSGKACEAR
jgi:hypothetical protein